MRLVFEPGQQRDFLCKARSVLGCGWEEMSALVGISPRSFRDWVGERTLGNEDGLHKISDISGVVLPTIIQKREEHWSAQLYARKGALTRLRLYGPPGTPEGRRKGGLISQSNRQLYPERYPNSTWVVKKLFVVPDFSEDLAELVGIILGDGGLTKAQLRITLNSVVDRNYSLYVKEVLEGVFGYKVSIHKHKNARAVTLIVTGVALVEYLTSVGLMVGNKVRQQVDVPGWIKKNGEFSRWCLRGLMDTDGAFLAIDIG